ncbi:hypothetical protein PQU92_17025 [Asticcacaulis sp. BYS171W]|uniref:KTSC domain-containing protein n=1 Tax=Asticcacaulis aquaticus TaxID=2984212 RepID=A0ABT5HY38_9CAUL|nr:hypothetical protein [Asticcacaulis aquaticus]MDC7684990.1 hypothetical protein [Asticcacaulis aquaticus]
MKNPDFNRSAPKPAAIARKNPAQAAKNRELALEALKGKVALNLTYEGAAIVAEVHTVGQTKTFRPAMLVFVNDAFRVLYFDEAFDVALSEMASSAPRDGFKAHARDFRKFDAVA